MEATGKENLRNTSIIEINNLSFKYNQADSYALSNINLEVKEGELVLICGPSGCGKTTLLKHIKNLLKGQGSAEGEVRFKGCEIDSLPKKDLVSRLGYVFQNPDNQIVCDNPITEMAFGLENLGVEPQEIRRRIAEMASYFGLVKDLYKDVNTLSGGWKQILNLASVMAMQPDVLLLDEPTSMLDPVSCGEFFSIVNKLNKELGLTIIIVEHNLESLYAMADRVCYMEDGKLEICDSPENVANYLIENNKKMLKALPASAIIYKDLDRSFMTDTKLPLNVRDARSFLKDYLYAYENSKGSAYTAKAFSVNKINTEPVLTAKSLFFRYNKKDDDILKDVSLSVNKGEFLSIHGDNGCGKTTLLKVLAGINKAYSGKLKTEKCAYLPQNQLLVFVKDDIHADILYVADKNNIDHRLIGDMIEKYEFFHDVPKFYGRNPLDLSCGEQQRLALFKMMLTSPEILLLDEPTKSLDSFSKEHLAGLLTELKAKGTTIVMVSHDLDFSAKYADNCAFVFDGTIISKTDPLSFFTTNHFYTTTSHRIANGIVKDVVNLEQLV